MRQVYLAVIILFVLATLIVAVQNLESVTVASGPPRRRSLCSRS